MVIQNFGVISLHHLHRWACLAISWLLHSTAIAAHSYFPQWLPKLKNKPYNGLENLSVILQVEGSWLVVEIWQTLSVFSLRVKQRRIGIFVNSECNHRRANGVFILLLKHIPG